jgi:hypothetical protein
MALGTTFINKANSVDSFIPELWSDEILDALEHRLVMAKLVNTDFSDLVKGKGDVIHIPNISNLQANQKATRTAVTVQAPTSEPVSSITIDQHWEVSFLVEDLAEIQTAVTLRQLYTKRAGYAIAKKLDDAIIAKAAASFDLIDSTSTGNSSSLDEDDILLAKTLLDEADCPQEDRHLVVAPQMYNKLLKLDRFTAYDSLGPGAGGAPIQNGLIGSIYGFTVWMTQNIQATGTGTSDTVNSYAFHRDALALCVQLEPRVQATYVQEYLGWLVTVDIVYGLNYLRSEWGVTIQNDAITYTLTEKP